MNKKFHHRKRQTSRHVWSHRRRGRAVRAPFDLDSSPESRDRKKQLAWKLIREEYTATEKIMESFEAVVQTLTRASLLALGYRVHSAHHRLKRRKK